LDNLTHTLLAVALAKTPLGTRSRYSMAALVVGSNLPDADAVAGFWGKAAFLEHHRGISHSLLGLAVETAILGGLCAWCERRAQSPIDRVVAPQRGPWLAAAVGLFSHLALDFLNSYGVRPLLPFSKQVFYGDMLFIVDPWAWILFGGAAALAGARTRAGSVALAAIGLFAIGVGVLHPRAPGELRWVWPVAATVIALLRMAGVGLRRPTVTVCATLAVFLIYCAGMRMAGAEAASRAMIEIRSSLQPDEKILRWSRAPMPANPFRWNVIMETEHSIWTRFGKLGSPSVTQWRIARNLDTPALFALAGDSRVGVWRDFARHPFVIVRAEEPGKCVFLCDARYGSDPESNWSTIEIRAVP
jgi:inner membrane protein